MTDEHHADRPSFLRTGAIAGTALVAGASGAIAQQVANTATSNAPLTKGDIDIQRRVHGVDGVARAHRGRRSGEAPGCVGVGYAWAPLPVVSDAASGRSQTG
jgi:hypothetical protein